MCQHLKLFLAVFFVIAVSKAHGVDKSEADLKRYLLENYDRQVRPVRKTTDTIQVKISLGPHELNDVDVKDREVKLYVMVFMLWQDAFLTWDPAEYGVTQLVLPQDAIWKPDLALYTAKTDKDVFVGDQTNAIVYHNGTVLWVPAFTARSKCQPTENQITEDTFQCTLKLGSGSYHTGLLDIQEAFPDPLTWAISEGRFYNIHEKWILETMTGSSEAVKYSCCHESYSLVKYDLLFRKRSNN